MKPNVPTVLNGVIANVSARLGKLPPGSEAMGLWGLRVVLSVLERDWNEAASRRVDEIRGLAGLISRGAEQADAVLRERLSAVVDRIEFDEPDLRLPALDAELDGLRAACIELQTALEAVDTDQARSWLRESWALLAEACRKRAVHDSPW